MTEENERNPYLPDNKIDPSKLSIDLPAQQFPVSPERIPFGYDPMGEIQLRGQAFRGMAGGRTPWWVLISGWIVFGGSSLFLIAIAISSFSFTAALPLAIAIIPLLILWRGTMTKLRSKKRRRR